MKRSIRLVFWRIMVEKGWAVAGTRLVAGVSGGVDSMVLLHLLRDLSRELGMELVAAHLNHELRGDESERDARFVEEMAEKWGIPIEVGREDVKAAAKRDKIPVQVAARRVRYRFFDEIMAKRGADWLALGHNADDVAETVMMRWLRGTSVEGLKGIPLQNGRTIRPLLTFTREEIREYAEEQGIPFVEDSSNLKMTYLRNRIRHDLIPRIAKEYQPAVSRHLNRYARYFSEIHDYLSSACDGVAGELIGERGEILLKPFVSLHAALQRVFMERYLLEGGWIEEPLGFDRLEEILKLAKSTSGSRRYAIGKGRWLVREYDRLFVTDTPVSEPIRPVVCPVPGTAELREIGNRLTVEEVETLPETVDGRREAYVDGDGIGAALWIRSFRPGDRIVTSGTVKVKKLFIDRKIPARLRPAVPIVGTGDEIVWVGGVCVNRRFYVKEGTRRILHLKFSRPIRTE